MPAYRVIADRVKEVGITKIELSKRLGMNYEGLRRALAGKRKISADEFILFCAELGLSLSDFEDYRPKYKKRPHAFYRKRP